MAPTPYIKELFSIAIHLAKSLSERIPRSSTLQHECKQLATRLRTWRDKLPPDVEFLRSLTGDRDLYRAILSPLSELLCILCQLTWTADELSKPFSAGKISRTTISRTTAAEQKIASACPDLKKSQRNLGVWQKPRKGHAPLAVLFDPATKRGDAHLASVEGAVSGFVDACRGSLWEAGKELAKRVERARGRHVGLRLLAGKAI